MTEDVVIRAEGLGKKYVIGHEAQRERYVALRDVIARTARNAWRKTADLARGRAIVAGDVTEDFWALKDVNFEIKRGEVVGVIGRNGAGKSTLLKILSRITEPTQGQVTIKGRVGSLLEVGTGFHPELTGRENIFLNGAILGMSRREIQRKFHEIVAFAEIEKFLDTPVKRYSSGMYVRLGFAIAAHLEPEVLAVDEVLAVGDAQFQKKCLGKIGEVARDGRTVLFVSHNMNSVERLCQRLICLDRGRLTGTYEDVREGIMVYLRSAEQSTLGNIWRNRGGEYRNEYFVPEHLEIASEGPEARPNEPFSNRYPIHVFISGTVCRSDPALNIGIAVYAESGELLFLTNSTDEEEERWPILRVGPTRLGVKLPARLLNEGSYRIELLASLHYREWLLEPARNAPSVAFSIQGGLSDSPYWDHKRPGLLGPVLAWKNY